MYSRRKGNMPFLGISTGKTSPLSCIWVILFLCSELSHWKILQYGICWMQPLSDWRIPRSRSSVIVHSLSIWPYHRRRGISVSGQMFRWVRNHSEIGELGKDIHSPLFQQHVHLVSTSQPLTSLAKNVLMDITKSCLGKTSVSHVPLDRPPWLLDPPLMPTA